MSARTRSPVKLGLVRVPDEGSHRNFAEVNKAMSEMHPVVSSKETGAITLVAGVNRVRPPISHPSGRQVIWQNAHATIIDVQETVDDDGFWLVDASAPCTVKFLFY